MNRATAKVLVAEPYEECRALLRDVLELAGYAPENIAAASDAGEAVALLDEGGFDVIVTSLTSGRGRTRDLLETIKAASPSPLLVILYSDLSPDKLSALRTLGFGHLVPKTALLPEMLGILQRRTESMAINKARAAGWILAADLLAWGAASASAQYVRAVPGAAAAGISAAAGAAVSAPALFPAALPAPAIPAPPAAAAPPEVRAFLGTAGRLAGAPPAEIGGMLGRFAALEAKLKSVEDGTADAATRIEVRAGLREALTPFSDARWPANLAEMIERGVRLGTLRAEDREKAAKRMTAAAKRAVAALLERHRRLEAAEEKWPFP